MPLLPGGARGGVPRIFQCAFALAVLSLGWQGFDNVHRYSALRQNLDELIQEVEVGGQASFRAKLVEILELNSVPLDPADIQVSRDATGAILVRVPCRFRFSVFGWHQAFTKVLEARALPSGLAAIEP